MTKAKIKRLVDAAIEAARKHGVAAVEVKIDNATVRIPLAPDKTVADSEEIVL
jgi:LDH2 family malate/lactate/ureidoglycolate dehydrogenase